MSASTYPVHVDARPDPEAGRGLWLVKWLLALPHYVVLVFLWAAFLVLSVVAWFSILFTGRYPRGLFDFNVGVLRWSWRVAYYAYGALGTDRYPPFSLREDAHYPAGLSVDYPAHLSRGLALVKWWLLAVPHYLVLGFFLGGGFFVVRGAATDEPAPWVLSGGLIGLLVLIAAVVLLFTGRYPRPIYDLVLGLNRWVIRVAAYAALMTDAYPPFRLDQGGPEPAPGEVTLSPSPGAEPTAAADDDRTASPTSGNAGWTTPRITSVVVGSVFLLFALGTGIGATALAIADTTLRDDQGYLMSDEVVLESPGYAVSTENIELNAAGVVDRVPGAVLGNAKVSVQSAERVFVGLAPTSEATAYLRGVDHSTWMHPGNDPVHRMGGLDAPRSAPDQVDIWTAQAQGSGPQELTWPVRTGAWTVVVMNADASPGVAATVSAGVTAPGLDVIVGVLLIATAITLVMGLVLVVEPLRAVRPTQGAASEEADAEGSPR